MTKTPPGIKQASANENLADEQGSQRHAEFPKTPSSRTFSDLRDAVIRIRDEGYHQQMRRSISMYHLCQTHVSVGNQEGDGRDEERRFSSGIAGSSKQPGEACKVSNRMSVLQCAMKRSFSSGRLFLARQGRVRDLSVPLSNPQL
ncbi:uncharacterized protein LOC120127496 [Hibiscus syriacus]|nr:uncharacterized protein LOC120114502 [Hibiscus syriacus]XP_039001324.1 uncharacterized protein LOC120127496 [Hibiscus syriacus]